MKTISVFILLFNCLVLSGQYDDFLIGSEAGYALSLDEEGAGSSFGVDVQKHLTLGVYGVLSYKRGHMTIGQINQIDGMFYAENMRQYSTLGLGLRKVVFLSPKNEISLSFIVQNMVQRNVAWGLARHYFINERYSQRSDLTYTVSLDYTHRVTDHFSLGFYAGYYGKPNLVNVGIRTQIHLNKKSKDGTKKFVIQKKDNKNAFEFRFCYLGGKRMGYKNYRGGVTHRYSRPQFDLEYSRPIWKFVSLYGKFSTAQKHKVDKWVDLSELSEEELSQYPEKFLADDNEAGIIWLTPNHSTSYGAGLKFKINAIGHSEVLLSAGLVYNKADVVEYWYKDI